MRVKILKISKPPMHKQFSGQNRPDFPKSQEITTKEKKQEKQADQGDWIIPMFYFRRYYMQIHVC